MTLREESQLLEVGRKIELWVFDATVIKPEAGILRFHGYPQEGPIVWQGESYFPWPIEAKGFARTSDRPPSPTLTASNLDGSLTALCLMYDDLVGAVVTRKRTTAKYLDAVNFEGGNPTANPNEHYPDELWFIDRKEYETHEGIKWSLSSALDFNGVSLPRRLIVANQCSWRYRGEGCMYAGGPVAMRDDTPTNDPALDDCSKRPSGCKLRFGADNPLPYGGFPAAGLMRS
jgi:lambda family phage minor tail protein L